MRYNHGIQQLNSAARLSARLRFVPVPGAITAAMCYHHLQTAIGLSVPADDGAGDDTDKPVAVCDSREVEMFPFYTSSQNAEFAAFVEKLPTMDSAELGKQCEQFIWLSAYAANNPRSNFHRMADALSQECDRRGTPEIYSQSHEKVSRSLR